MAGTFKILWLYVVYVLGAALHGHQLLLRLRESGDQARQAASDAQRIAAT
jgi:hypothetical protein